MDNNTNEQYSIVKADEVKVIRIGYEDENQTTKVVFDVSKCVSIFGENGIFELAAENKSIPEGFPVAPVEYNSEDKTLEWIVDREFLKHVGYGMCQWSYYIDGERVKKSRKYTTECQDSIGSDEEPPEDFQPWIDQAQGYMVLTEEAARRVDELTVSSEASEEPGQADVIKTLENERWNFHFVLPKGDPGTTNYEELENLPTINGETVTGDLTSDDLHIYSYFYNTEKIEDYLYEAHYTELDYPYAINYFKNKEPDFNAGLCSSVRKNNIYGRNLDWVYNNNVEFVIKTPANNQRYATIGVAGQLNKLTKDFVESGAYDDAYKILPFMLADGINSKGLVCNINVVPLDKGSTTGTTPAIEEKYEICALMLPRFILDNFASVDEATSYLNNFVSIYCPDSLHQMNYEVHFMLADMFKTCAIEFIENEMVVVDITDKPYMTNFYLSGVEYNLDGSVYTPSTQDETHNAIDTNLITEYGAGLERYNILNYFVDSATTVNGMRDLLDRVIYTKTYDKSETPFWYTEFVGGTHKVNTEPSEFDQIIDTYIDYYEHRVRGDNNSSQTVHSSIYDMENRRLYLRVQEGTEDHVYRFNYYNIDEIDAKIDKLMYLIDQKEDKHS